MKKRNLLVAVALGLVALGAVLIGQAAMTPWHTDPDAYFAGLAEIRAQLYGEHGDAPGMDRFDDASGAFHALQDLYRTPKWLFADLGYAALAWSVFLIVLSAAGARLCAVRRVGVILPLAIVAVTLLALGAAASAFHGVGREQIPEWADTMAIPLIGAIGMGMFLLPSVLALALGPVILTRREPLGLWPLVGRGWATSVVVSLFYLVPIVFAAGALIVFWQPGGWAVSTGGAILLWLMLNARAVWLGRAPAPATRPVP